MANTKRNHDRQWRRWLSVTVALLGLILTTGCGGGGVSVPSTVPVTGIVKFKGKPARGVRIKFYNKDSPQTKSFIPAGETGPDGGFVLSTGAPQNGAPPGTYVVTFERPMLDPKNSVETEIDGFKGKYSDPASSQWTVTVAAGDNSLEPFELQ